MWFLSKCFHLVHSSLQRSEIKWLPLWVLPHSYPKNNFQFSLYKLMLVMILNNSFDITCACVTMQFTGRSVMYINPCLHGLYIYIAIHTVDSRKYTGSYRTGKFPPLFASVHSCWHQLTFLSCVFSGFFLGILMSTCCMSPEWHNVYQWCASIQLFTSHCGFNPYHFYLAQVSIIGEICTQYT